MKKTVFTAFLSLLVLSGCQQFAKVDQQLVASPDPVGLRLASAADKASAALQALAAVEQSRTPSASIQAIPYAPEELRRSVSVTWNGGIEEIVTGLANRAGYTTSINGAKPATPVVVNIQAKQKSVVEILRDVGLQADTRADIVVDSDRHIVELNYAPITGG